jgi:hypothetical protein
MRSRGVAEEEVSVLKPVEEPKQRRVQRRRSDLTWYRYIVRIGPRVLVSGITENLAAEQTRAAAFWPSCDVFQVGDPVSLEEARGWAAHNGFGGDVESSAS